MKPPLSQHNIS